MEPTEFTSYAFRDLTPQETEEFARQYRGVDMAQLMGASEHGFPFLIRESKAAFTAMWWSKDGGMKTMLDEDPVRSFATIAFLRESAYPVFDSLDEAKQWAIDHDWPLNPGAKPR